VDLSPPADVVPVAKNNAWKATLICHLAISKASCDALLAEKLKTIGELNDWLANPKNDLTSLHNIGPKAAEKIENAMDKFLSDLAEKEGILADDVVPDDDGYGDDEPEDDVDDIPPADDENEPEPESEPEPEPTTTSDTTPDDPTLSDLQITGRIAELLDDVGLTTLSEIETYMEDFALDKVAGIGDAEIIEIEGRIDNWREGVGG